METNESSVLQGAKPFSYCDMAELGIVSAIEELLIMDTAPKKLKKRHDISGKNGFFGIEAHTEMPIEAIAVALASTLFARYEILVVDSFQLMNGLKEQNLARAVVKTRENLQQIAETFNLSLNFSLCSEFFGTRRYQELFRETEAAILKSSELTDLVRKTIPENADKNNLSYAIHEIATTRYMHLLKGADVKVGQRREKLYDAPIKELEKGLGFAYLLPFFALTTETPEEVTPYKPYSGTKNGGKRILVNEFDKRDYESIAQRLDSGPAEAQLSLYKMALAAGVATGRVKSFTFNNVHMQNDTSYLGRELKDAMFRFVIRPYERIIADTAMQKFLLKT